MKLNVPPELHVPERTPPVDRVIPGGNAPPATPKVYGPVPPLATTVLEYACPANAEGIDTGVSVIVEQLTVSEYARSPVQPSASVAVIVKFEVPPGPDGVPESRPPDDSVRPTGKLPVVTAKVYGPVPPDAVTV